MGIATAVAASFIKSKLLLFCGIMLNLGGYIAFILPPVEQPTLMGVLAIISFLIPGIILHLNHKSNDV